jgi:hypothetical protein
MAVLGTCLSFWGIIQLSFMALAFYSNSVAFVEDLPENALNRNCTKSDCSFSETVRNMKEAYEQQAQNCGMAVALYVLTLIVSMHQLWMNSERESIIRLPTNPQRGRNAYVRQFDNVPMDSL